MAKKGKGHPKVWRGDGELFFLGDLKKHYDKLENWVYRLEEDPIGNKYLRKLHEGFTFDYKIYGLESKLVDRVIFTYEGSEGNLGILLNGLKGTGKTVTSKIICNKLQQPVIIVDSDLPDGHLYLNDIPQNITIFIDEYEKIFSDTSSMLTIMDGALNSEHRRVFVLTTNRLNINENLLQRPSRIRYLKTFKDLTPPIIREILEDVLLHKELLDETATFISSLEMITVDIVKAIVHEVNLHHESPYNFADVFNVKKIIGKYDVYMLSPDLKKEILVKKGIRISPRKDFDEEHHLNGVFYLDNNYIGEIKEIIDEETIKVLCRTDKESNLYNFIKVPPPSITPETTQVEPASSKRVNRKKKEAGEEVIEQELYFRVFNSFMTHNNYKWDPKETAIF